MLFRSKEHPMAEYLKLKSWYLEYSLEDQELLDAELFIEKSVKIFEAMQPFNDYLNRALEKFQMPSR